MEIEAGVAKSVQLRDSTQFEKPSYRLVLELPCNCSKRTDEDTIVHNWWTCFECKDLLEYAFDEYFYCKCGRAKSGNFQFKCNRLNHGGEFQTFQPEYIQKMLDRIERKEEINILILGETGVGKSTWINSMANYMTYSSLEEAEKQKKLLSLIGASFTTTNDKMEIIEIKIGDDKNEDQSTGQSATQNPKSYLFELETRLVRFIDTPGICDTRGYETDKKNFDNILTYLANLDKLNGVCILLKPNEARLDVLFRFCIQELLTHLHKDVSKNIVFCFTNTRGTQYKPGETLKTLKKLLEDIKTANIPLVVDNIFCLDNEAFRFLCSQMKGLLFDEKTKDTFAFSWKTSAAETNRMIERMAALEPHSLTSTLSLNKTRALIVSLTRPMVDGRQLIQTNLAVMVDKETEIKNCKDSKLELEKKLYIPVIDLVRKHLNFPRMVCTAPKCMKINKIPNTDQRYINFATPCHENCYLLGQGVFANLCPNRAVLECEVFNRRQICTKCGCGWETHMHIRYEYEQRSFAVKNEAVEREIQSNASDEERISKYLEELKERTEELEEEQNAITDACVKFGCYLKTNAIAPYNDALADYLTMLIGQEKLKVEAGCDGKVLEGMNKMKESYYKEKEALEEAMKNEHDADILGPLEIKNIVQKLYTLKIYGSKLKEIVGTAEAGTKQMVASNETVYRPKINDIGECVRNNHSVNRCLHNIMFMHE